MTTNSKLEDALMKTDAVILKRLKFIHKILKANASPKGSNNRNINVYLLEVLDAVGDAEDTKSQEILDMIDQQLFPLLCQIISTFNVIEFNAFQSLLLRYTLIKWKESSNFHILEFISDIYAFIIRLAPLPVVFEYIYVFSWPEMPPQITLIIFPAILCNLTPKQKAFFLQKKLPDLNLLALTIDCDIPESLKNEIISFWRFLTAKSVSARSSTNHRLLKCICTSSILKSLQKSDLITIMDSLANQEGLLWDECNRYFSIVCVIFLSSVREKVLNEEDADLYNSAKSLLERVKFTVNNTSNIRLNKLVIRVLQKILENTADNNNGLLNIIQSGWLTDEDVIMERALNGECELEFNSTLTSFENCIEKLRSSECFENSVCKEKIAQVAQRLDL